MSDALEKIAEAVDVNRDVLELKGEFRALSATLRSHLAQQATLNERMDRQLVELASQSANMRERLVRPWRKSPAAFRASSNGSAAPEKVCHVTSAWPWARPSWSMPWPG